MAWIYASHKCKNKNLSNQRFPSTFLPFFSFSRHDGDITRVAKRQSTIIATMWTHDLFPRNIWCPQRLDFEWRQKKCSTRLYIPSDGCYAPKRPTILSIHWGREHIVCRNSKMELTREFKPWWKVLSRINDLKTNTPKPATTVGKYWCNP